MKNKQESVVKQRFERDAVAFNAIYDTQHEFSGWFNRHFRKPIFERYNTAFEVMGDLTGKTVLDIGCGSGVYSIQCASKGARFVKGIDFSAPMLQIAEKRAKDQAVTHNCEFELNDFLLMEAKEPFDFSIAMGVFDYLTEPLHFLQKIKAVTRGKLIASFPGHSVLREPLRKLRYLVSSKGQVFFYDREDIKQLTDKVGFSHIEIRPMQTGSGFVLIATV